MSEVNQSYGKKDSERPEAKKSLKPVPVVTRKEDEDYYEEQHYTRLRS
jgi:hypothetical protein